MRSSKSAAVRGLLPVIRVIGLMLMLFSGTYLLPIACALIYGDGQQWKFLLSMVVNLAIGTVLWLLTRHAKRDIHPREGFLLVALTWSLLSASATLPLMLGIEGLSFTDAMFETVSGITTTGGTVLTGLDTLAPSLNFWRHQLSWLGGLGIIVLAVAILPLLGVGGMQLYKAETPGPIKDDKLTPRITQTAKSLWLVYIAATALCAMAFRMTGMSWFDAICHAFATLSLGGASTHDSSFAYFNSPAIEGVAMFFMVFACINFATHFQVWRNARLRNYWQDPEARAVVAVLAVSIAVVSVFIWLKGVYPDYLDALRYTAFNLISIASTTGFASTDYNLWPAFAPLVFLLLSCVVSSSGSTGGGIKMIRLLILFKQSRSEMFTLMHPNAVQVIKLGGRAIPQKVVTAVLGFIHLYSISVLALTFILLATGLDFASAFTAVIASINNTGPGMGVIGPASNFGVLSDFQTWVCTFAMLLGRLEIFTVFVIFTPSFWRD